MKHPEEEFEEQLRQSLRHVEAPAGFAERVAAAAAAAEVRKPAKVIEMRPRMWFRAGSAIAAAVLLGIFAGEQVHMHHEQQKAALAAQQFDAAMRVTDHALDQTMDQLDRAGVRLSK